MAVGVAAGAGAGAGASVVAAGGPGGGPAEDGLEDDDAQFKAALAESIRVEQQRKTGARSIAEEQRRLQEVGAIGESV